DRLVAVAAEGDGAGAVALGLAVHGPGHLVAFDLLVLHLALFVAPALAGAHHRRRILRVLGRDALLHRHRRHLTHALHLHLHVHLVLTGLHLAFGARVERRQEHDGAE